MVKMAVEVERQTLVVFDPTEEPISVEAHLAPRIDSLDGKVLGLLDNSKLNADRFLDLLEQELREKYRLAGVVRARKPTASRVCPDETLADMAARCDAVVTAVGD